LNQYRWLELAINVTVAVIVFRKNRFISEDIS